MDPFQTPGVTVPFSGGVEWRYELRGERWVELAYERGQLRSGPDVVTFDIVLAKMPTDALREEARRIDTSRRGRHD